MSVCTTCEWKPDGNFSAIPGSSSLQPLGVPAHSFPRRRPRSHTLWETRSADGNRLCNTNYRSWSKHWLQKMSLFSFPFSAPQLNLSRIPNSQNRQFEPSSDLQRTIRHIVRQRRESMCKHSRFLSFLCGISWRMLLSATVYRHFSRLRIKRRHPQRWDHFRHWQDSQSRGA